MKRAWLPLLVILSTSGLARAVVDEVSTQTFTLAVEGHEVRVPCYRNLVLDWMYPFVEHAVVMVHGDGRSGRNAIETVTDAAALAGEGGLAWLFVAPQFLLEGDVEFHVLPDDYLFWSDLGWKQGNLSLDTAEHPRPVRVSSFAVLDSLLVRMAEQSPNLQSIVVAGHSAGGQFVQRFAAGSLAQPILESCGIEVSYVVANPSSYLYWNAERVVPGTRNEFEVPPPETITACPGYDDYKYGLLGRNAYMSARSDSLLRAQYRDRLVTVLLGELDTDPNHSSLDTSCPAALEGAFRRERGIIYHAYLGHFFGATAGETHRTISVPGVAHDSHDMFTSECGVAELFGGGECAPIAIGIGELAGSGEPDPELRVRPNPFRSRVSISFRPPAGVDCALGVHDAAGRRVRTLPAPTGASSWDGRGDDGAPVAAGVYFVRLECGAGATRRVVVLR